jgi:hypothetical protein
MCASANRSERRIAAIGEERGVGEASSVTPEASVEAASEAGVWDSAGGAVTRDVSELLMKEMVSHDAQRRRRGVVGRTLPSAAAASAELPAEHAARA